MNKTPLPSRPNIELYKKLAKDIVKVWKSNVPGIVHWEGREVTFSRLEIAVRHPRFSKLLEVDLKEVKFSLADAQFLIAREYGFESWPKFAEHIAALRSEDEPNRLFLIAATVPLDGTSHVLGDLTEANEILAQNPGVGTKDIFVAAVTGNIGLVRLFLARNPKLAKRKGGPHGWDALCYLCFSRYLRLDSSRSDDFVACARALLEAGANANTGWFDRTHSPEPEWESALYGATGVAQHPGVTQVLLDFGADPNDNETPYHAPETYDNRAVSVLIGSGKLSAKSLSMMLVRKSDFHDLAGVRMLLEAGADPNLMTMWKVTGLHHAIRRDNNITILDLLLDHGADPKITDQLGGQNGIAMAARRGRGDFLASLVARGVALDLNSADTLVAACAMDDREAILAASDETKTGVRGLGGALVSEFSGTGNAVGVGHLLYSQAS